MNYNDKVKEAQEMMYGSKTLDEEVSGLFPTRYMETTTPFKNFSFGSNDMARDKTILRKRRYR